MLGPNFGSPTPMAAVRKILNGNNKKNKWQLKNEGARTRAIGSPLDSGGPWRDFKLTARSTFYRQSATNKRFHSETRGCKKKLKKKEYKIGYKLNRRTNKKKIRYCPVFCMALAGPFYF